MGRRLQLHDILKAIPGVQEVYFQPPEGRELIPPYIRYKLNDAYAEHADDIPYTSRMQYLVTVVDANPDSAIRDELLKFPLCKLDRPYTSNNLNHYAFRLYY